MQLPVQHVAPSGARPGDRGAQVRWGKSSVSDGANRRAVTPVNPYEPRNEYPAGRAFVHCAKAAIGGRQQQARAAADRGGVVGTARRDGEWAQLGRPGAAAGTVEAANLKTASLDAAPRPGRIRPKAEIAIGPRQESEGSIVATKRGNARRAKGPWLFHAGNEEKHGGDCRA